MIELYGMKILKILNWWKVEPAHRAPSFRSVSAVAKDQGTMGSSCYLLKQLAERESASECVREREREEKRERATSPRLQLLVGRLTIEPGAESTGCTALCSLKKKLNCSSTVEMAPCTKLKEKQFNKKKSLNSANLYISDSFFSKISRPADLTSPVRIRCQVWSCSEGTAKQEHFKEPKWETAETTTGCQTGWAYCPLSAEVG